MNRNGGGDMGGEDTVKIGGRKVAAFKPGGTGTRTEEVETGETGAGDGTAARRDGANGDGRGREEDVCEMVRR